MMVCSIQDSVESWLLQQPLPYGWSYFTTCYLTGNIHILDSDSIRIFSVSLLLNCGAIFPDWLCDDPTESHISTFYYSDPAFPDSLLERIIALIKRYSI